jgi:hypothetical protein
MRFESKRVQNEKNENQHVLQFENHIFFIVLFGLVIWFSFQRFVKLDKVFL